MQLVTIAVTALITIIAKDLWRWTVALVKNTAAAKTIAAIVKTAFNKTNRAVIFDILALLFYVVILINFALDKAAPSKFDILIAIGAVLACIIMAISLLVHIFVAINASKKQP